jgi:CheY-like chemotaxis protein
MLAPENVIQILLVDDSSDDVLLTRRALKKGKVLNNLSVVDDGVEAINFLHRRGEYSDAPRPDIILLDLNMPKKDGREVLSEIKADDGLKQIPVVVLTTSEADIDILESYSLHANCYVTKPVDLDQFMHVIQTLEDFWFNVVKLPRGD